MACFDNIVGLRSLCSDTDPDFFLEDIGINKSEIEQVITKDYTSVQDFIDKKSAFAVTKVTNEVYNYLKPNFKADSILAGSRIGYESDTKELVAQTGYVGIEINLYNPSSFVDFVISDISLFVNVTSTVPVLLYDIKQGLLLETIIVPTTAGVISTLIQKVVVPSQRRPLNLWLGYDATAIDSYKVNTHNGCGGCRGYTFSNRFITATGAAIDTPFTSVEGLTHTGGISLNYSVNCNHTDWLCSHRQILGLPILYKTGIEIVNHVLTAAANQRTVSYTTSQVEVMEKKLAMLESEYRTTMGNLLGSMQVPQDRNCFHCNNRIVSHFGL